MPDEVRVKHIMRGLRPNIKNTVKMHVPTTLSHLKLLLENVENTQEMRVPAFQQD